jgi:glycosyltransferase involved in cell wall biosynthesis
MQSLFRRLFYRPLVSVIVCTKNGMPYVRDAMASLERQTYRRFEVVVQDAVSQDGTAEFMSTLPFDRLDVVSELDGGIGDAYNRAVARCSGAIVATVDADNLLEPKALERAVALHAANPRVAAFYGAVQMLGADAVPVGVFVPQAFNRAALMRCELVPPFSTSFFSRAACGPELGFDVSLRTCADYDLWLRLSDRKIVRTEKVIGRTRLSAKSMSRDASRYGQFCRDKIAALERYLERHPEFAGERAEGIAGIYCWAAESLLALEGPSEGFATMVRRAATSAPHYGRVGRLAAQVAQSHAGPVPIPTTGSSAVP